MKQELDEALCKDFPNLYKQRHGDMRSTAMMWGFECGPGWEPLIRNLSRELEAEILKIPEVHREYICASQVKEKYGTLRFYCHSETDEMSRIIRYYEHKSAETCEECGKTGTLRGYGWLSTKCDEHSEDQTTYEEACKMIDKQEKKKFSIDLYFITKWFKYPKYAFQDVISNIKWKLYLLKRIVKGLNR